MNQKSQRLARAFAPTLSRALLHSLLLLGTLISIVLGYYGALHSSKDFQWSPSVLMWRHLNPFDAYLSGSSGILQDHHESLGKRTEAESRYKLAVPLPSFFG